MGCSVDKYMVCSVPERKKQAQKANRDALGVCERKKRAQKANQDAVGVPERGCPRRDAAWVYPVECNIFNTHFS